MKMQRNEVVKSSTRSTQRATLAAAAMLTLAAMPAYSATGTWTQTTAGPFNWDDIANWSSGAGPIADGADSTANFTANITAAQVVNLNNAKTIGNITFTDSTTSSHDLTISGANILTLDRTDATKPTINVTQSGRLLTISSVIAGNDGLLKSGAGTLVFNASSNNTFTGGFDISGGVVRYDSATNANAWGDASNAITFTGSATLHNNDGAYTIARSVAVNDGVVGTLSGAFGEDTTISGVVSGSGELRLSAGSNGYDVIFSNTANTHSGTVWLASSSSGNTTLAANSLADSADSTKRLKMGAGGATADFTLQGSSVTPTVWTNRAVELAGTTGAISISNNSTNSARTLTISPNLAFTAVSSGNKTLTLGGSNTGVNGFAGNITNNGTSTTSITKSGAGTWALSGTANTFSGTITLSGTTASAGTLSYASAGGANPIQFNQTTAFGTTLSYTGATPLTMSGKITASALTSGAITLAANGSLPTATINYSNTTSLDVSGGGTVTRFVAFSGSNTGDNTFAGTINNGGAGGAVQVSKSGAGKWVLTGNGNYSGGFFLNEGTVSIPFIPDVNIASPLGAVTRINLGRDGNTGTLIYTGAVGSTNRDVRIGGPSTASGVGGSTILNDGTGALTFAATTFNPTQTGIAFNRTLTLGGSYTGGINEIQGVIQDNTASTGLVGVIKTGAGTWKLSGTNTYTGATAVNAGTLLINGNNTGATGTVTVASTATLGGTGSVGGATTVNAGGIVSPGNSIGTLSFVGNLTIDGTYLLETASVGQADLLDVGGTLTLGGASVLDLDPLSSLVSTETYVIADYTGGSLSGTFFSVDSAITATHGVDYLYNSGTQVALVPIPEPTTLGLLGLGAVGLLRRRRVA